MLFFSVLVLVSVTRLGVWHRNSVIQAVDSAVLALELGSELGVWLLALEPFGDSALELLSFR